MKKIISAIITLAAAGAIMAPTASGQASQTSYFLDNYVFGYRTNPAAVAEKGFVGLGIGNINASLNSNIGITTLLYPSQNGGLVTAFNSEVSSSEFLGKLKKTNSLAADVNENILAMGWRTKSGGYTNFEINVRAGVSASLPYDLFAFLKNGSSQDGYDLSSLNAQGNAYIEVAYGLSKKINNMITVGARVKALVGAANMNVKFNKADLTVNGDKIAIETDAELRGALSLISVDTKQSQYDENVNDVVDFKSFKLNTSNIAPCGYGAAVDLGVTVTPIKDLTVSASVVDLGGIAWNYSLLGYSKGTVEYTGFEDVDASNSESSIQDELNRIKDQALSLTEFHKKDGSANGFEMLPCTINAGVRYKLPVVNFISVGALMTKRISKYTGWFDTRAGLTLTPMRWFSLTGNVGRSSFGNVCGAALSMNLLGMNLHLSADGYLGGLTLYPVSSSFNMPLPIDTFRYSVNAGLTMQFGKRPGKKAKD